MVQERTGERKSLGPEAGSADIASEVGPNRSGHGSPVRLCFVGGDHTHHHGLRFCDPELRHPLRELQHLLALCSDLAVIQHRRVSPLRRRRKFPGGNGGLGARDDHVSIYLLGMSHPLSLGLLPAFTRQRNGPGCGCRHADCQSHQHLAGRFLHRGGFDLCPHGLDAISCRICFRPSLAVSELVDLPAPGGGDAVRGADDQRTGHHGRYGVQTGPAL